MPHPLSNPFDKRKPPTLTNAEAVGKVSGLAARQAMEELLSRKEDPIENTEYQMTDEERAAFEAEQEVGKELKAEKKRKEYIAWADSFIEDDHLSREWVDKTFTFNSNGTVEVKGDLFLDQATTPFPKGLTQVGGSLFLDGLSSTKGLILPREVGGSLFLSNLSSAVGLKLPEKVGFAIVLSRLRSSDGLILPNNFSGYLHVVRLPVSDRQKIKDQYPNVKML